MHPSLLLRQAGKASSAAITRSSLQTLQQSYAHTASSFQSYNFREYFERIAARKFSAELDAILSSSGSSSTHKASSLLSSSGSGEGASQGEDLAKDLDQSTRERLQKWWDTANKDLEAWKRAAIVNNMFQAPRLVVEGAGNIMSAGGGGAGMEASPGGAGQPVDPDHKLEGGQS